MLAASDLYDYDYSDYYTTGSYSVTFGGEISSPPPLPHHQRRRAPRYYTTNHGEQRLTDTLTDALEGRTSPSAPSTC